MSLTPTSKRLPSRPYSHRARWGTDSWTWEIGSCLLSILATVTVVILLLIYDEKPLPDMPHHIGINSVVAIVGTVSKSALLLVITSCISQYKWLNYDVAFEKSTLEDLQLHDEASRGPWGAFMLLINWRGLFWVKLGALVIVLSMAFDPAYQALIRVEQKSQYRDNPIATVKRALDFQDPEHYVKAGTDGYFSNEWNLAITNAILSNTSSLETEPSCPTGNCTFPIFSNLAFCSNCIDVTQYLQQTSKCIRKEIVNPRQSVLEVNLPGFTYMINCTYWLPLSSSGLNYSYFQSPSLDFDIHNGSDITLSWNITDMAGYKRYAFVDAPSFITRFLTNSKGSDEFHSSDGEFIPSSFATIALIKGAPITGSVSTGYISTANICAFSLCAREYNISKTSGLLRFDIVSTSYSNLTLHEDPRDLTGNSSYTFTFPNNSSNDFTFFANKTITATDGRHYVQSTFEQKFNDALRKILWGDLKLTTDELYNDASWTLSDILQNGLNASVSIPKTMDRVAAAMTNRLRDVSNLIIQGQSGSMEVHVRVSWLWLFLPALSIFLGMALLVSIIIATRRRKLPVWKTSELALLFHGLDFPLNNKVEMHEASAMEQVASALQVRLAQDPEGVLKLRRKLEVSALRDDEEA